MDIKALLFIVGTVVVLVCTESASFLLDKPDMSLFSPDIPQSLPTNMQPDLTEQANDPVDETPPPTYKRASLFTACLVIIIAYCIFKAQP